MESAVLVIYSSLLSRTGIVPSPSSSLLDLQPWKDIVAMSLRHGKSSLVISTWIYSRFDFSSTKFDFVLIINQS
jgi:hypothetical protein